MLASSWLHWLDSLGEGFWIVAAVCFTGAVIGVTAVVAHAWRRVRQSENRAALIGLMLQRGMSSSEIERILQTGAEVDEEETGTNPEVRIIELMKEGEYSGDDIERALAAARADGRIASGAVRIIETLMEQEAEIDEIENILEARRSPASPQRV
jgi:tellurite resistance protein